MRKLALAGALWLAFMTHASAFDDGRYDGTDAKIRQWFKDQRSPTGVPCCDLADGHRTTWRANPETGDLEVPIEGQWIPVPPETIIRGKGNPVGEPIVWYWHFNGVPKIHCFVHGSAG